uniref:Archease domain-containing protein n=1 Tax=Romanomermis culicivorax TaxID=13658 RepID=A0A915J8E6_ROMCU
MKFLDSEKFNSLCSILSYVTSDCRLESKIELYSCKMVHQDKRMFKDMLKNEGDDTRASDLQALATPIDDDVVLSMNLSPCNAPGFKSRHTSGSSDADPDSEDGSPVLCDAINRKRLFDLIGVLNASFADYDFTAARGENFSKVASCEYYVNPGAYLSCDNKASSLQIAKRLIDSKYFSVSPQSYAGVQMERNDTTSSTSVNSPSWDNGQRCQCPPLAPVKYEYLDHTADVQIHAWGNNLDEAFEQAATGMFAYTTEDKSKIEAVYSYDIEAQGDDMPSLLFHFLDEWLYAFSAEPYFIARTIKILEFDRINFKIKARGWGEQFDTRKHPPGADIKAITYSNMQIYDGENQKHEVYVIVDI